MEIREIMFSAKGDDPLNRKQHVHADRVEILQILSGSGSFLVDDTRYPITRGAILFIDSDSIHCSAPEENEPYVRNKVTVNKNQLLTLCELGGDTAEILDSLRYFVTDEPMLERISALFEELFKSREDSWHTLRLFSELLSLSIRSAKAEKNTPRIEDPILDYINRNLASSLTLEEIAEISHFSKYHFCRVFKQKTGMTPMQYVRLRRVSKAKELLAEGERSISEIAVICGYDNFGFFCRVFRSLTGMTPSKYRKNSQKASYDS